MDPVHTRCAEAETPTAEVRLVSFDPERHTELLREWLGHPHVVRWWGDAREVLEHVQACPPDRHAVIVADGTSVGYLCWQPPPEDELTAAGLTDLPDGLVDIDIMIGEPASLGRGIGPLALGLLLERLRRESAYRHAGVGTSAANTRAIRAFEKAGFRLFREYPDPVLGPSTYLVTDL